MLSSLLFAGYFIVFMAVFGTLAYGALSAAPWVPLGQRDVERLLHLAQLKPGELLYDLGCGDGRLLVTATKLYQVRAVGFEVALVPYLLARLRIYFSGTSKTVSVHYRSFWTESFKPADAVVCFLTPQALKKLEAKIPSELCPGARFVTYAFKLKSMTPTLVSKPRPLATSIYLYTLAGQSDGVVDSALLTFG